MYKTMLGHFSSDETYITRGKFWIETEKSLNDPSANPRIMMAAYKGESMIPVNLEIDLQHNQIIWSSNKEICKISNRAEILEHVKQLMARIK